MGSVRWVWRDRLTVQDSRWSDRRLPKDMRGSRFHGTFSKAKFLPTSGQTNQRTGEEIIGASWGRAIFYPSDKSAGLAAGGRLDRSSLTPRPAPTRASRSSATSAGQSPTAGGSTSARAHSRRRPWRGVVRYGRPTDGAPRTALRPRGPLRRSTGSRHANLRGEHRACFGPDGSRTVRSQLANHRVIGN